MPSMEERRDPIVGGMREAAESTPSIGAALAAASKKAGAPSAVIVPRPAELDRKLQRLRAGGAAQLQVIADFDHTLSGFRLPDGRPCPMCHDIVEKSTMMPEVFRSTIAEFKSTMKAEIELGRCDFSEWWRKGHGMMQAHGLRRQWIPQIVTDSGLRCRSGVPAFFALLRAARVPALVLSAGLTPLIEEALRREGVESSSASSSTSPSTGEAPDVVRVLANDFSFDATTGMMTSFTDPPLHGGSKGEVKQRAPAYFEGIAERRCMVLLGDGVRDIDPLGAFPELEEAIKIGFFNGGRPGNDRAEFEAAFDVVLTNEGLEATEDLGLEPVIELLQSVLNSQATISSLSPPEKRARLEAGAGGVAPPVAASAL